MYADAFDQVESGTDGRADANAVSVSVNISTSVLCLCHVSCRHTQSAYDLTVHPGNTVSKLSFDQLAIWFTGYNYRHHSLSNIHEILRLMDYSQYEIPALLDEARRLQQLAEHRMTWDELTEIIRRWSVFADRLVNQTAIGCTILLADA